MTYKLPRTDDGEVDWEYVCEEIRQAVDDEPGHYPMMDILDAVIANARAEEREACWRTAEYERVNECGPGDDAYNTAIDHIVLAIRAQGDSQ